jgi:hypothetical protein
MEKTRLYGWLMGVVVVCTFFLCGEAAAIGEWLNGKVTKSPWNEQGYQFIQINNVRHTIMPGAKCQYLYTVNGATQKAPQNIGSLRVGDSLAVMVEGNRIYQIEKTR